MKKIWMLSLLSVGILLAEGQKVGLTQDQFEEFTEELLRQERQQKRQLGRGQNNSSPNFETSLRSEIYSGIGYGLSGGLAKGLHAPISMILNRFASSILRPAATAEFIRRSIFLIINDSVLTYEKLSQWSRRLNSSVNINMIDPANSSNKVLRRALLTDLEDGSEKEGAAPKDEHVFGIKFVIDQLSGMRLSVKKAIDVYSRYPISMKVFRPYSSSHLDEIIFLSQQLVSQLDQFIMVASNINDISQLTDRKDEVQKYLKNLISLLQDLGILVDPDTTFDAQYRGLKLLDTNTRGRAPGQGMPGGLPSGM